MVRYLCPTSENIKDMKRPNRPQNKLFGHNHEPTILQGQ